MNWLSVQAVSKNQACAVQVGGQDPLWMVQAQCDGFCVLSDSVECVQQIHKECVALPMQLVLDVGVQVLRLV